MDVSDIFYAQIELRCDGGVEDGSCAHSQGNSPSVVASSVNSDGVLRDEFLDLTQGLQNGMASLHCGGAAMNERWCSECGQKFVPRPQSPRQIYCSQASCQVARKLLWQRTKRRSDKDYVANQMKANAAWARRNPDYWKQHRARDAGPQPPLAEIVAALSQALLTMCEDASMTDTQTLSHGARHMPHVFVERSVVAPGLITLTLKIEIGSDSNASSVKTRQETT